MTEKEKASIVAYFLSKFDTLAFAALGYRNQSETFRIVSEHLGVGGSFVRRRMNEFDVFMENSRVGYAGREPNRVVLDFHNQLQNISYDELESRVFTILGRSGAIPSPVLAPIYPDEIEDSSLEYLEGARRTVTVNVHERSRAAREQCIRYHGTTCYICGFDSAIVYGEAFKGLIHVHHITMVSAQGTEYAVDPIRDLRPVCPNCHMILHSRREGYSIEEIKAVLLSHKNTAFVGITTRG